MSNLLEQTFESTPTQLLSWTAGFRTDEGGHHAVPVEFAIKSVFAVSVRSIAQEISITRGALGVAMEKLEATAMQVARNLARAIGIARECC